MKKVLSVGFVFTLFLAVCAMPAAEAAMVEYKAENIGGDRWQYDYAIFNDSAWDIGAFTIFFDYGLYGGLDVISTPDGWDAEFWNPQLIGYSGEPGEVVAFALDAWLAPGGSLTGLSVGFDWYGDGAPGSQAFGIFDEDLFGLLPDQGGWTVPDSTAPAVPEPGTMALLGTGLAGLAAYYRSRKAGKR